jgi:TM2 domain-containing membrane protein YozV
MVLITRSHLAGEKSMGIDAASSQNNLSVTVEFSSIVCHTAVKGKNTIANAPQRVHAAVRSNGGKVWPKCIVATHNGGMSMYCTNCGKQIDERAVICVHCGLSVGTSNQFCRACGAQVQPGAYVCTQCGVPITRMPTAASKSKMAAGLLGIFLGTFGIHNFYLGYTNKAIAQVLLGTVGSCLVVGPIISGIWGLVEGIQILTGSIDKDAQGVPLKE